jgi:hypothetical protein
VSGLLDDVAAFLEAQSFTTGWAIFKSYMPDNPDRAICLYEVPGQAPETTMAIDYPQFQLRARGGTYEYAVTRQLLEDCYLALHCGNITDSSTSPPAAGYVYCYAKNSGSVPLGNDHKDRPQFSQDYRLMRSL